VRGRGWCANQRCAGKWRGAKAESREPAGAGGGRAAPRAQFRSEEPWPTPRTRPFCGAPCTARNLTEGQTGEMMAAAGAASTVAGSAWTRPNGLVEAGAASQLSLSGFLEEMDLARKEADLAESRANLVRELTGDGPGRRIAGHQAGRGAGRSATDCRPLRRRWHLHGGNAGAGGDAVARQFGKLAAGEPMAKRRLHRALGFDIAGAWMWPVTPRPAGGTLAARVFNRVIASPTSAFFARPFRQGHWRAHTHRAPRALRPRAWRIIETA